MRISGTGEIAQGGRRGVGSRDWGREGGGEGSKTKWLLLALAEGEGGRVGRKGEGGEAPAHHTCSPLLALSYTHTHTCPTHLHSLLVNALCPHCAALFPHQAGYTRSASHPATSYLACDSPLLTLYPHTFPSPGEVRVYHEKRLASCHSVPSPVTALWFGRYGREDDTLVTLTKSGSLDIKVWRGWGRKCERCGSSQHGSPGEGDCSRQAHQERVCGHKGVVCGEGVVLV